LRGMFILVDSRQVWEQSRAAFSPDFARFVDREIIGSSDTGKSD
jgi:hypothetical protein